jgi:hypothetical protein
VCSLSPFNVVVKDVVWIMWPRTNLLLTFYSCVEPFYSAVEPFFTPVNLITITTTYYYYYLLCIHY